jgi:hypothetical protein
MSNTIDQHLQTYKLQDPLLDLETKPAYVVERSAQSSNIRYIVSTQSTEGSITFNYLPSSSRTIISRNIRTDVTYTFTFNGQDQGTPLLGLGSTDSFLMLNYGVNQANLSIDNGSNYYTESDVFPILHRYLSTKYLNENMGYTFNCPDLMYNYDLPLTEGFQYNVNRNFGESAFGDDVLHGRYWRVYVNEVSNTNTQAVVQVRFISPIMLKPLESRNNLHINKGLFGVEQLNYTMTMQNDLYKYVWAHAPSGNVIDSVTYALTGQPRLLVQEFELQPDQALPLDLISYDFSKFFSQVSNVSNNDILAAGATTEYSNTNNQLGGTPEYIMFYFREKSNFVSPSKPKTALKIEKLKITFDTMTILSEADPTQIYEICKKNEYNGSAEDFFNYSGSYIKLKFPTDINVQALDAVGRLLKHQLTVTATVKNQTDRDMQVEMPLVISYAGVWVKGYNYSQPQQNIVSANDVLNSQNLPALPRDMMIMDKVYGGLSLKDVYDKAKTVGPKAVSFLKDCGPRAIDLVNDLRGKGLEEYGAGRSGGKIAKRGIMHERLQKY